MLETEKLLVTCPKCRKRLRVKPELAGKRVRCPNKECGNVIAVLAQQLDEELAAPRTGAKHIWVLSAAGVVALAATAFGIWFFVLRTPGPTAAPAIAQNAPTPAGGGGESTPGSAIAHPKAGFWEGEFTDEDGKGHKLRLWVGSEGKTVDKGSCVAVLHGGSTITNQPVLLEPAPIVEGKFRAEYVDNSYYFHGAFTSATAAQGKASLSFQFGVNGLARLTGQWTAKYADSSAGATPKKPPSVNLDQGIPATAVEPLLQAFGYELPENGALETRTSAATGKTTRKFFRQCKHAKLNASMIYAKNPDAPSEFSLRSGTFTADDPASRQALTSLAASIDPALGKAFQEAQSEFDKSQKAVEKDVGKFRVSVDGKHVELSLNWMPAAKKLDVEPAPEKKAEDAPRAKNISESKAWSVKLVKASRGVIENWAYLDVEFKALTPEKESVGERLVAYKEPFLTMGLPNESYLFMIGLGNVADYTRKLGGGSPTPEQVFEKPSRVFFSGAVILELPDGKRLRPYLTSMPKGLLEFTPTNSETIFGFASARAVGGANPDVLRFICERGGSTLALVQPNRSIQSKLSFDNVPAGTRTAKLHFADCPPIEVTID